MKKRSKPGPKPKPKDVIKTRKSICLKACYWKIIEKEAKTQKKSVSQFLEDALFAS